MGPFVERYGPRRSLVCWGFYGTGMLLAGLATAIGSVPLFYLGYGIIGGIGLGVGYISPVSTLVKYFPTAVAWQPVW